MAGPGTVEPQLGIAMANPGTAELQLGIAMADPGTAELQLGIGLVNNFPMMLKSKRRLAQGCHLQNDAL